MAPKRLTPLEYPPSASSDNEVEEEVSHAEEEEEMAVNGAPAVQKPAVEHESSDSDETDDSQLNSGTVKSVDAAAKPRDEEKVLVTNGKKRKKRESEEKKPGEELKKHRVFGGESEEKQIVSDSESDDITMNHLVRLLSTVDSGFGVSEESVRIGLSLIGKTERVKMTKQLEKLLIDEKKLMLKRIELLGSRCT